jgi:homoserine kinase
VRPVVFVPQHRALTATARKLLPDQVPHAAAAANAGRAALLVHALTADPALLLPATRDWLHQEYRAAAMPASAELVRALRAAGIPAVISGAGPTVLAFTTGDGGLPEAPDDFAVRRLEVDPGGALAGTTIAEAGAGNTPIRPVVAHGGLGRLRC